MERAKAEPLVIVATDEGHRVYSPANPATTYLVTGIPDSRACTCPDFEYHAEDPDWRCKHVLAVEERLRQPIPASQPSQEETTVRRPTRGRTRAVPGPETPQQAEGPTHMLLKRSVSPDGRIDSLSIEFALPVAQAQEGEIRSQALAILTLQDGIIDGFRKKNGNGSANGRGTAENSVPAQLLAVGATETRFGRRLFISVKVNGKTLKLFGSDKQLADAVASAGYPDRTDLVEEGAALNLPCRVTTKPSEDGKYLNVERVFPAEAPRH
jgi:hypothetical protein